MAAREKRDQVKKEIKAEREAHLSLHARPGGQMIPPRPLEDTEGAHPLLPSAEPRMDLIADTLDRKEHSFEILRHPTIGFLLL